MDSSIEVRRPGWRASARHAYATIAFHCVLATFGVVFLGWNIPATLLYWLLPRPVSVRVGQFMIMRGFRALLGLMQATGLARFDLSAIDALRGEAGLVIAPNHPTLIDALLVVSRLPRVVCITKASLWDNPALGAGARLAGYIRNDTAHRLVRAAAGAVAQGSQLLIFHEGTRTTACRSGGLKEASPWRAARPTRWSWLCSMAGWWWTSRLDHRHRRAHSPLWRDVPARERDRVVGACHCLPGRVAPAPRQSAAPRRAAVGGLRDRICLAGGCVARSVAQRQRPAAWLSRLPPDDFARHHHAGRPGIG